jgi:hypothetical protein
MSHRLALALAPLLLVGACGDQQPATVNDTAGDDGLAQENVVAGDVTAIDAATADDSRMANDTAPPLGDLNELGTLNEGEADNNGA